jgi:hypothetical protein
MTIQPKFSGFWVSMPLSPRGMLQKRTPRPAQRSRIVRDGNSRDDADVRVS